MRSPSIELAAALAGICLALSARAAETPETVVFTDVTRQAGVAFTHSFGDDDMSSILEATGSGCLFFDYDDDGLLDLYAVNGRYLPGISETDGEPELGLTNHLFRNLDGTRFGDVTVAAAVGDTGYGMACVAGDYDNDGATDLYITNYGPNVLYHNDGDGTFTDLTAAAGVGDTLWGVGVTFLDYDIDGDLDLYVGNYLEFDPDYRLYYAADKFPGPLAYPGQPDVLYRNNGDGTFADVSAAAGIVGSGRAMGLTAGDYDNDGYVDLFVANDAMGNALYHNNGDGTFADIGLVSGVAFSGNGDASSSMGGDFGDFDRDGDLDLLVPDMAYNNFYVNLGDGRFDDRTSALGVAEVSGQYVSWHGDLLDCDNDGDLDIFISNGDAHHIHHTQEALFLANASSPEGPRHFVDVSGESGEFFYNRSVSRGSAAGDYDNDGDQDLFVLHLDQPSMLLRNDGGNANHWLLLDLEGTRSNRDALGARVRVRSGDLVQVAESTSGMGYLSQNDPRLHFGLGSHARADTVQIRWPAGGIQVLVDVPADRIVEVVEP